MDGVCANCFRRRPAGAREVMAQRTRFSRGRGAMPTVRGVPPPILAQVLADEGRGCEPSGVGGGMESHPN